MSQTTSTDRLNTGENSRLTSEIQVTTGEGSSNIVSLSSALPGEARSRLYDYVSPDMQKITFGIISQKVDSS
ncbi:hypothetical protein Tdes44962_MAKER08003 [Teratosphaeria destructans]|uniref:Uncharacterized protein n=1 Tax=Teratosphaeria destructans TaxID=418781 RepID=A0A9W7W563_9PEZI|nr:hypothetical protein Tdes44962_MAKER08003 [Teratosphaeria destructans]